MKFSVLLSIYYKESPEHLSCSLDSILAQSLQPDEIILVKDGPLTAELDSVITRYEVKIPNLRVIPLNMNVGLGNALNEGLKHCNNDLIARMDTDDICRPDRFAKQINVFRNNPNVDVVSAWIEEFEGTEKNIISVRRLPEMHSEIYEYGKKRCPINHPVVMFRKTAVIAAGGYKHMPLFEDYYLWVRMLVNGAIFYNIQETLLSFRASKAMFMRRGGLAYAITEIKFLWLMHKMKYSGLLATLTNIVIRFTVRVMPNYMRIGIYKRILR